MRIGSGYDVHKLVEGRKLILGGVQIDFDKGLLGHSDADVLTHAIMDALLGAAGMGDIGKHFPDNDDNYKDISSMKLLYQVLYLLKKQNYSIEQYKVFMRETGLFELLENHIVNNLVDYCLGVETGLDSNGRKNRGGHLMEDLAEAYIKKCI